MKPKLTLKARLLRYLENLFVGADEEVNAVLGGSPDETLSARTERAAEHQHRWGLWLRRVLDRLQKNHCEQALKNRYDHPESVDIED